MIVNGDAPDDDDDNISNDDDGDDNDDESGNLVSNMPGKHFPHNFF